MSTTTDTASESGAKIAQQTTNTEEVTYTDKTTEENKTKTATIAVNEAVKDEVETVVHNSAFNHRWRNPSQFAIDAIIFYLDGGSGGSDVSAREMIDNASWNSDVRLVFSITPTLHREIEMMVEQQHTPWNTKQEFQLCAVYNYFDARFPFIPERR
jgi:hypothetical protein